jgi:predicted phosphohydrolase
MRVVVTEGLCYVQTPETLERLAGDIQAEAPDLFIIAGNIGEPLDTFRETLSLFEGLPCPRALVTGNRDVWHREEGPSSQQLWEESLMIAIRAGGFVWLEQENLVLDGVGVCGTVAWYDYSGRDTKLGYTAEQYEQLKGLVSSDARHIDWPWSDRDFASYLHEGFASRIEALERNRAVEHILVITHIPVFKEAIMHIPDDIRWRFGAAYTFNLSLGRVIAPKTKVRHVVSGHTRLGGEWDLSFGNNTFKMRVIGRSEKDEPHYVTIEI